MPHSFQIAKGEKKCTKQIDSRREISVSELNALHSNLHVLIASQQFATFGERLRSTSSVLTTPRNIQNTDLKTKLLITDLVPKIQISPILGG